MAESHASALDALCSGIELFDAEQKVANFILDNPARASEMTSAELAQASGSSEATISRFSKHLGFSGFRAFQRSLTRDVAAVQPTNEFSPSAISLDNIEGSLETILRTKLVELEATVRQTSPRELERALTLIDNAGIVQIAAVGNTIPVAMDATFKFNQLGIRAITTEISEKASAFALTLTPRDALFLISHSGKSRRLMQLARVARAGNVPVVLITNDSESPLAKLSTHVLPVVNRERLLTTREFQFSRIQMMLLIEILYHFLYAMRPDARERLDQHESLLMLDKKISNHSD